MPALVLVISAPAPKSRRIEVLRFLRQIKWLCLLRLPRVKKRMRCIIIWYFTHLKYGQCRKPSKRQR